MSLKLDQLFNKIRFQYPSSARLKIIAAFGLFSIVVLYGGAQRSGESGIKVVKSVREPLTSLGFQADNVFSSIGSVVMNAYQLELETFIIQSFPAIDSDLNDPNSLLNALRSYFPIVQPKLIDKLVSRPLIYNKTSDHNPAIPSKLFQTAPTKEKYGKDGEKWKLMNPKSKIIFHDNIRANDWVQSRFFGSEIVTAWKAFEDYPSVVRADFWRYLVIGTSGGHYADTDCTPLRPFDQWDYPTGSRPKGYRAPSIIVGIEADVGNRSDWNLFFPRPLQISQWTFSAARGHPILIDTIRRVVNNAGLETNIKTNANVTGTLVTEQISHKKLESVMEISGPGVFTDSVLRHVGANYNLTWADFRNLSIDGWRYHSKHDQQWGDLKILQITGFSAGVGTMGAEDVNNTNALVNHGFRGSWIDPTD